jgi:hypothetical protein
LAAAAGYPLVGDDVLRVDIDAATPVAFRGASEIRLREGAEALAKLWPGRSRVTADGRTSVGPPRAVREALPLGVLVFPLLERERDEVEVERLRSSDAFVPLLGCPRLLGWRYPPVIIREFDQLTVLAATVACVIARVPWRTPVEPTIGAALIDRVLNAL